ncbi:hypothetical protein [Bordetella genomosp. 9]|nr:hypothetical protein [Bordetella genomosp. 9]
MRGNHIGVYINHVCGYAVSRRTAMVEYRNVIVLQDARAGRDNLVQELARRDYAVRSCGSLAGFFHLYAQQPSVFVLLLGQLDDLARNADGVRSVAPAAVIIALGTPPHGDADAYWRVRVMAAGADACHPLGIDSVELAAILASWERHVCRLDPSGPPHSRTHSMGGVQGQFNHDHCSDVPLHLRADSMGDSGRHGRRNDGRGADRDPEIDGRGVDRPGHGHCEGPCHEPESGAAHRPGPHHRGRCGWRLDADSGLLADPRNRTLRLTVAERRFLVQIAASPGLLLRRPPPAAPRSAASRTDPVPGPREADAKRLAPRGMDVLVSRLRRKGRHLGMELPLLAVHGCGYMFAERLTVTGDTPASRAAIPWALPPSAGSESRPTSSSQRAHIPETGAVPC